MTEVLFKRRSSLTGKPSAATAYRVDPHDPNRERASKATRKRRAEHYRAHHRDALELVEAGLPLTPYLDGEEP